MTELIQIVPNLPPVIDGIGDHALQMARRLREHHQIETSFVVCDPSWSGDSVEGFRARRVCIQTAKALASAVDASGHPSRRGVTPILLHFSPYGYQKRGCPFWLVAGLEELERCAPGRVNTVFHELNITGGRIWSSTFWVPPLQKSLIKRIARMGTFRYTNTGDHRSRLEKACKRLIPLIPNFATLGELETEPAFQQRKREIVVFGRADQRKWTYERGAEALGRLCRHFDAEVIHDVGAPIPGHDAEDIDGFPIVRHGVMPADELSQLMQTTLASFLYYPIPLLSKSSVHAFICASGALPFVYDDSRDLRTCACLTPGVDYFPIRSDQSLPLPERWEGLSSAVYQSYQGRSSAAVAELLSGFLAVCSSEVSHRHEDRTLQASLFHSTQPLR